MIFHIILEVKLEIGPGWVGNKAEEKLCEELDPRASVQTGAG